MNQYPQEQLWPVNDNQAGLCPDCLLLCLVWVLVWVSQNQKRRIGELVKLELVVVELMSVLLKLMELVSLEVVDESVESEIWVAGAGFARAGGIGVRVRVRMGLFEFFCGVDLFERLLPCFDLFIASCS